MWILVIHTQVAQGSMNHALWSMVKLLQDSMVSTMKLKGLQWLLNKAIPVGDAVLVRAVVDTLPKVNVLVGGFMYIYVNCMYTLIASSLAQLLVYSFQQAPLDPVKEQAMMPSICRACGQTWPLLQAPWFAMGKGFERSSDTGAYLKMREGQTCIFKQPLTTEKKKKMKLWGSHFWDRPSTGNLLECLELQSDLWERFVAPRLGPEAHWKSSKHFTPLRII